MRLRPSPVSNAADAGPTYPAFTPPPPQIQKGAAAAIHDVTLVPVHFRGDAMQPAVDAALGKWVASKYFMAAVAEYGVASGTLGGVVPLAEAAPATLDEWTIEDWLKPKLESAAGGDAGDGGSDDFGPNDATTLASKVFVLFYPSSTVLTSSGVSVCGTGNGGYSTRTTLANGAVAYFAVVPSAARRARRCLLWRKRPR